MAASRGPASDVAGAGLSAIKEMALAAAAKPRAVSLSWGLPSFRTPEPIRRALTEALASDPDAGKYTLPGGLAGFREAAARDFAKKSGRAADPATEVIATAGNMEAVRVLLRTLLDPGDEVIVTDPGFTSHLMQIRLAHGRPVFLPLDPGAGWQPDPDRLEALITPRTKALLLVTPHNPTGVLFGHAALSGIGRIAERQGLLVILDDPYSHFVYDRDAFADPLRVPELAGRLAYLSTMSKAYAMSGFRAGYMVLPPDLTPHAIKVHDATMICAPRPSQIAAAAALDDPDLPPPAFRATMEARRDKVCARLDRLIGLLDYVRPEGAYYVFPRLLGAERDSRRFAFRLLDLAGVAVTPGAGFGPGGEGHVRIAYCVEDADIDTAFDRIDAVADQLF